MDVFRTELADTAALRFAAILAENPDVTRDRGHGGSTVEPVVSREVGGVNRARLHGRDWKRVVLHWHAAAAAQTSALLRGAANQRADQLA
jgi:hypothetical protein